MNVVTQKFLDTQENVSLTDEYKEENGKRYRKVSYGHRLPWMALLRNLRNISQAGVSEEAERQVYDYITNPTAVANSKQLPFDLLEAYKAVKEVNSTFFAKAVSQAMDISLSNIPSFGEKIWVIVDFSGSMGNNDGIVMSNATLLASAILKSNNNTRTALTLFGSGALTLTDFPSTDSLVTMQHAMLTYRVGEIAGYTQFDKALNEYNRLGFIPDTIIVCTDGEVNRFPYQALFGLADGAIKLVINMEGAQSTPFIKSDGWHSLSGFSSSMFKFIEGIRNEQSVVEQLSHPF
jgi:hypothetical protein